MLEYDESLIVPDPGRSLLEGAIDPWTKPRYESRRRLLLETARKLGVDPAAPWQRLKPSEQRELLYGKQGRFVGIFPFLKGLEEKRYKQYIRVFLRQYQLARTCPACHGTPAQRSGPRGADRGRHHRRRLAPVGDRPGRLASGAWSLPRPSGPSGRTILAELESRVAFLRDVGLGYLSLERQTRTLSGGEAQRIALANALGSRLVDSLYVLDEPSIGLHPRDTDRLLGLLRRLRDAGNTVVVVEHDLAAMRRPTSCSSSAPGPASRAARWSTPGPSPRRAAP